MLKSLFANDAFAVVRIANFRYFLGYRFLMTMATLMQSVIVGWHIYFLTKNVFWLGFVGLVEVIPQVGISLFAGHYIDLWNRKKIIGFTTSLLLIGSAILFVFSIESLNFYALLGIWPIFVTVFLTGLARGILMPAHTALMGNLVEKKFYANAATWSSINWHVGAVLGPAFGGVIYALGGIQFAYFSVFLIYLLSLLLVLKLQVASRTQITVNGEESIFSRIKEGIHFVLKTPELVGAFSLDMFAVLFGGAVAMLPVFASDVLHVGPAGLGFLRACPALGAIVMSVYLMFNPPTKNSGRLLLAAVAGFGLCMIGFAFSQSFWLSASLLVLSGFFDNVSVVIRGTILQLYTPDAMRGRVASVNSIFIGSSNELGAFESGATAKLMGLVPSVVFGGVMTLVVVGVMAKTNPVLRKLNINSR
ncbi:MAG: MFS transporter [Bacteroidales bacterium]